MEEIRGVWGDDTSITYMRRELARVLGRWLGNVPTERIKRGYAVLIETGGVNLDAVNAALGA